jgi:hypothetical protein
MIYIYIPCCYFLIGKFLNGTLKGFFFIKTNPIYIFFKIYFINFHKACFLNLLHILKKIKLKLNIQFRKNEF